MGAHEGEHDQVGRQRKPARGLKRFDDSRVNAHRQNYLTSRAYARSTAQHALANLVHARRLQAYCA